MAEIKIEKKKPTWPWVVLVLFILALIAFFAFKDEISDEMTDDYNDDPKTAQYGDSAGTSMGNGATHADYDLDSTATAEVSAYDRSIANSPRSASDSTYSNTAFVNLSQAVARKAKTHDLQSSEALERLERYGNQTNDSSVATNSVEKGILKNFKSISEDVTEVLEAIQTKAYPSLKTEISTLKQHASKLDTNNAWSKQPKQLQSFLEKARAILNNMNP
ncbi:hypothetical protein ESY86_06965 [Subsaximicrobium wynnwilliamsii]|uniref:Uncharacterized protein n=1 Tax=Subsaximicrobium wynnwilliamsii TaxID=291179 RepID=A0A5C6ZJ44_9FLAO|nr:hypothetical protein [Subsaximicrobium wynnwilliamsii]TXD81571.1 hypothetical protein ESY87_17580 [Subsaximicrobium wynnwilliamsii]TXD89933.1 hypothetical protein ESY86_06965 [Subsaximicrobium wynnwilliamsii]TXE01032.1 hypothetical protein ESY88_17575 [Subsaximicrobium wynnwilliamsii]